MQVKDEDFLTDDTGKYLKPDSLHPVLRQFQTGQEATKYFVEDKDAQKVYLKSSLNQSNPNLAQILTPLPGQEGTLISENSLSGAK